jgi:hypothetical protein
LFCDPGKETDDGASVDIIAAGADVPCETSKKNTLMFTDNASGAVMSSVVSPSL